MHTLQFFQRKLRSDSSLKKTEPPEPSLTPDELVLLKEFVGFLNGGKEFSGMDRLLALFLTGGTSKLFFLLYIQLLKSPSAESTNKILNQSVTISFEEGTTDVLSDSSDSSDNDEITPTGTPGILPTHVNSPEITNVTRTDSSSAKADSTGTYPIGNRQVFGHSGIDWNDLIGQYLHPNASSGSGGHFGAANDPNSNNGNINCFNTVTTHTYTNEVDRDGRIVRTNGYTWKY